MAEPKEIEGQETAPGWKDRIAGLLETAKNLLSTRSAILQEELHEKGSLLSRALLGLGVAFFFGWLGLLLLTAFLAALLSQLLGSAILGLLATFLLYAAVAGGAAAIGIKALSRVKPLDFPVTARELRKDWKAFRAVAPSAAAPAQESPGEKGPEREARAEDLESRFREGSE